MAQVYAHCDACHSDLYRGTEIEHDVDYDLHFCDRSCADEYYHNNPNALYDGTLDKTFTVDEVLRTETL